MYGGVGEKEARLGGMGGRKRGRGGGRLGVEGEGEGTRRGTNVSSYEMRTSVTREEELVSVGSYRPTIPKAVGQLRDSRVGEKKNKERTRAEEEKQLK